MAQHRRDRHAPATTAAILPQVQSGPASPSTLRTGANTACRTPERPAQRHGPQRRGLNPSHALPGPPGALARRPAPRPRGRARPPDALLGSRPPQGANAGPPGPGRGRRPPAPRRPAGHTGRPDPPPARIKRPQGGPQRPAAPFYPPHPSQLTTPGPQRPVKRLQGRFTPAPSPPGPDRAPGAAQEPRSAVFPPPSVSVPPQGRKTPETGASGPNPPRCHSPRQQAGVFNGPTTHPPPPAVSAALPQGAETGHPRPHHFPTPRAKTDRGTDVTREQKDKQPRAQGINGRPHCADAAPRQHDAREMPRAGQK